MAMIPIRPEIPGPSCRAVPLKKPCRKPTAMIIPVTILTGRGKSAAISPPRRRNESADNENDGLKFIRRPIKPPINQASGKKNRASLPGVLPRRPAYRATARAGIRSSGVSSRCPIPSYTGPIPVVTRWAAAMDGLSSITEVAMLENVTKVFTNDLFMQLPAKKRKTPLL